jgi:hypothetical protein
MTEGLSRFDAGRQIRLADALGKLPGPTGARFAEVFRHGSLQVEVYAPRGHDAQTPRATRCTSWSRGAASSSATAAGCPLRWVTSSSPRRV